MFLFFLNGLYFMLLVVFNYQEMVALGQNPPENALVEINTKNGQINVTYKNSSHLYVAQYNQIGDDSIEADPYTFIGVEKNKSGHSLTISLIKDMENDQLFQLDEGYLRLNEGGFTMGRPANQRYAKTEGNKISLSVILEPQLENEAVDDPIEAKENEAEMNSFDNDNGKKQKILPQAAVEETSGRWKRDINDINFENSNINNNNNNNNNNNQKLYHLELCIYADKALWDTYYERYIYRGEQYVQSRIRSFIQWLVTEIQSDFMSLNPQIDVANTVFGIWKERSGFTGEDRHGGSIETYMLNLARSGFSPKYQNCDHTMVVSGYRFRESTILGITKRGEMCYRPSQSVSVISTKPGYHLADNAAHELGHSMGARHDGDKSFFARYEWACARRGHIMAPTASRIDKVFSECSQQVFNATIAQWDKWMVNCLRNQPRFPAPKTTTTFTSTTTKKPATAIPETKPESVPVEPESGQKPDCDDIEETAYCASNVDRCKGEDDYYRRLCPKTCNVCCEDVLDLTKFSCVEEIKKNPSCTTKRGFKEYCRKSCGFFCKG